MLTCSKCDYITTANLKFAIINNICPSCGHALLSEEELSSVKDVGRKLKGRECSVEMSNYAIYDLSLFIYNNFIKKNKSNEFEEHLEDSLESSPIDQSISSNSENYIEEEDISVAKLNNNKSEEDIFNDSDVLSYSEKDGVVEDKVQRLKRLARESRMGSKTGARVRRSSD